MLHLARRAGTLRLAATRRPLSTGGVAASPHQPNAPLDLDPSLQALLRDVDASLTRSKKDPARAHRELEMFTSTATEITLPLVEVDADGSEASEAKETNKSPAALFGSLRIGATILPDELQYAVNRLIEDADKPLLHEDAKRLFFVEPGAGERRKPHWDTTYDVQYKSYKQNARHFERDGTAFASVALPSHYSAISAVLDHVKQRLGPTWNVERVIDWQAGTGSGLWASGNAFQKSASVDAESVKLSQSSLVTYLGIDKRDGLTAIGKRLLQNVTLDNLSVSWQRSLQDDDKVKRTEGNDVLALSAFALSSQPTPAARKQLVKEMWESGAEVIILIDHSTTVGFEAVAEARDQLLRMGRREMEDPEAADWPVRGSHVVAPCPHDHACPLQHSGKSPLICGFQQRIQRPEFLRKTKHSGVGHEDVGYSYVVVRRGDRPRPVAAEAKMGRMGQVAKRAIASQRAKELEKSEMVELFVDVEHPASTAAAATSGSEDAGLSEQTNTDNSSRDLPESATVAAASSGPEEALSSRAEQEDIGTSQADPQEPATPESLAAALRAEAYSWPRLVFPPLKRSGHVIIDCCAPEGQIMRLTIPKSQGKQEYYDARKSDWGDLFPHGPKNKPQERFRPGGSGDPVQGADIGKRGGKATAEEARRRASYDKLAGELKEKRKKERKERRREKERDLFLD